ncbi:hypothetical protein O9993_21985 [Vibrio lentus]|nr:hypothetical protein [Vibrio lentus]
MVVKDCDKPSIFYVNKLNFELVEDTYQARTGQTLGCGYSAEFSRRYLVLARRPKPKQHDFIGNQAGGRVFIFLNTDEVSGVIASICKSVGINNFIEITRTRLRYCCCIRRFI